MAHRKWKTSPGATELAVLKKDTTTLWVDQEGRLYGERIDPSFLEMNDRESDETWWIHLPRGTQTQKDEDGRPIHLHTDEIVRFPEAGNRIVLKNMADSDVVRAYDILNYPEFMRRGTRTTAINLESVEYIED